MLCFYFKSNNKIIKLKLKLKKSYHHYLTGESVNMKFKVIHCNLNSSYK